MRRRPSRVQGFIVRTTRRLEGHIVPLGLLVAAIGAVLAYIGWASVNGIPFQDRYELNAIVPRSSPIVQEGDAVRVAGRLAGLVTGVETEGRNAEIQMELRPSYAPVGQDASAKVRVKSLIYLTYVELDPGDTEEPMEEGGTIPLSRTGSNVDLLEVTQLFDRASRETLKRAIFNAGVGLAGRGTDLNSALADLPEITDQGTEQLDALTPRPGALAQTVRGAGRTFRGLRGERPDDIAAGIASGSETLGAVAARDRELGATIELLRPLEEEFLATAPLLDPVLDDATALSRSLQPAVRELAAALPDLNRVLALGDELRVATARLAGFMRPVLAEAAPVIAALEPTVASIDPLLRPLRRVIETMDPFADDITRSAEGVLSATTRRYPEGQTAPGEPVLRFATILTCHAAREAYPEPNTTLEHSQPC